MAMVPGTQLQGERTALTEALRRKGLCSAVLATGRHTCSTSLTARRQKRAEILGLKTWFQVLARNRLCWSQHSAATFPCPMLLEELHLSSLALPPPFELLLASSLQYLPIPTPHHSPDESPTFLYSSLYFFYILLPDPYGSISSPRSFSQCFHHSLSLSHNKGRA